ncbi:MAG: glycine cleavage T C-terminal barrel domain-containing protein, partial [Hyphomicrobiaceae bacterium]
ILDAGRPVGEVTSAAFGATLDRVVMLGYVETGGEHVNAAWIASRQLEIDVAGVAVPVNASIRAPLDPANERQK